MSLCSRSATRRQPPSCLGSLGVLAITGRQVGTWRHSVAFRQRQTRTERPRPRARPARIVPGSSNSQSRDKALVFAAKRPGRGVSRKERNTHRRVLRTLACPVHVMEQGAGAGCMHDSLRRALGHCLAHRSCLALFGEGRFSLRSKIRSFTLSPAAAPPHTSRRVRQAGGVQRARCC